MRKSHGPLVFLIIAWTVGLIVTGIGPKDRATWFLETFPVFLVAPILWLTRERFPLPRFLYVWIFLHGLVLMIGAHYTYAEVPLGFWVRDALGLERNNFDRLGHFLQGFVPALFVREILTRKSIVNGFKWQFFVTVTICMGISVVYEFIEWWTALVLGQGADAFLGTQGDQWDTQWDMFLATIGASGAQLVHPRVKASPAAGEVHSR